ncbi:MAG: HigA family addiction module antitoxin [Alphaproteobacteria bacterium]|jgi:addiction module HigA family antidote
MPDEPIKMGMTPAPVGEFILEEIFKPLDLSISKAARITKMRRPTLSDLVNGKARLSPGMALRLEKAFGVSMELLLRMQTAHEVAKAREQGVGLDVKRYEPASP